MQEEEEQPKRRTRKGRAAPSLATVVEEAPVVEEEAAPIEEEQPAAEPAKPTARATRAKRGKAQALEPTPGAHAGVQGHAKRLCCFPLPA